MGTLLEYAQRHVESLVDDLEGTDDFMPFVTVRGRDHDGIVYMGLDMPRDPDEKDKIADVMMAVCALHRAVEVVFASTSWMVSDDAATRSLAENIAPSQNANRVEVVFLHATDADGDSFSSAKVRRRDNTVSIGEWSVTAPGSQVGGRFGNAIHMGMELGRKLPPDMCAYIDEEIVAGRGENLVLTWLRALNSAREETAASRAAAERN